MEKITYLDPIQIGKRRTLFLFTYSDLLFIFLPIRFPFFSFYLFGSVFFLFTFSDLIFSFLFLFTFLDQLFHLFTFLDRQNDRKSKNMPFDRIFLSRG